MRLPNSAGGLKRPGMPPLPKCKGLGCRVETRTVASPQRSTNLSAAVAEARFVFSLNAPTHFYSVYGGVGVSPPAAEPAQRMR